MLKYSKQREAILHFLKERTDHPTADTVYAGIRNEFANISLGTVYRNLSLLASIGEIQKINCPDGADRFDFNTAEHYHVQCTHCGAVQDIFMNMDQSDDLLAQKFYKGKIQGHSILFYGTCPACLEAEATSTCG